MNEYNLFSDESERVGDDTFEQFFERFQKQLVSYKSLSGISPECFLCTTVADVFGLIRGCKCSDFPCTSHECKCSQHSRYQVCAQCIASCLWNQTNESLRKIGRYRSKCPFCKAEFCHLDVVLCRFEDNQELKQSTVHIGTNNKNKPKNKKN